MAYNTKHLKTDKSGTKAVPQLYNDTLGDYEVHKGENGAAFVKDTDVLLKLTDIEAKINGLHQFNATAYVSSDTTINVGGNYATGVLTETVGRELSIVVRFSSACKYKVEIRWITPTGTLAEVKVDTVIDSSSTASQYNAVRVPLLSPRFNIRVLNSDTANITLSHLQKVVF